MTLVVPSPDAPLQAITDLIREHARMQPSRPALVLGEDQLDYGALDALMDRVAASLQRDGIGPGDSIAICAHSSPRYGAVFLGALRAGVAVAPLAPSVTPQSFASMLADARPRWLFADDAARDAIGEAPSTVPRISLDGVLDGLGFDGWLMPEGSTPTPLSVRPDWPFNIIYSSGTTGTPKG
ncbi:MAG: class I adenylate-forming enzyme family protein, partial [Caldimonas sp.]